jgi:putrescine transport system ATP-binding protein
MVTHDQEEAMTMATRIAVMSEGKILQVGAPAEIYETPATRFVADFIGNVNLMDGKVVVDEPDRVEIDCGYCRHLVGHGITGTIGMAVSVALRPEKIQLRLQKPEGEVNQVKGTVRDRSYFGSFTVYNLELEGGARLKVSESNVERHRADAPGEGQVAWATWPDTAQVVLTQ